MMRKSLDWKYAGMMTSHFSFPIAEYDAVIGKDEHGREWTVRCHPEHCLSTTGCYVMFDYKDGDGLLFLRDEVLNADDYRKACREVYNMKIVPYTKVWETIVQFCTENGIE